MVETYNTDAVEAFIRRWQGREGGQERANYALVPRRIARPWDLPLS